MRLLEFGTPDELREHLDVLNNAGIDTIASGMQTGGTPFLICLAGPYAETEEVFLVSPWDSEVEPGTGTRCDECHAHNPHQLGDLRFPVFVIARPDQTETEANR